MSPILPFYVIQCMFWHHGANVLFAGTVESELWMWKIPSGDSKIYTAHGEKVEGAKLLPDGQYLSLDLINTVPELAKLNLPM
jgi:hypothetical protein